MIHYPLKIEPSLPRALIFDRLGTDNSMCHKAWDKDHWSPPGKEWQNLGGVFICAPEVVSWGSNRLDVFVLDH